MSEKVLLVQEKENESKDLLYVLSSIGYDDVRVVESSHDIVRHAKDYDMDFMLVDVYRPGPDLLNMIAETIQKRPVPVIMFVEESSDDIITDVIKSGVSAYVVDGYQRNRVRGVISLARVRFEENQRLLGELEEAKSALNGRKLIDRAKGIVMKQKACDEETAYKLIRKMAMDKNVRITDVAKQLIDLVDLMQ